MTSRTFSGVSPISLAISSTVGSRPSSWEQLAADLDETIDRLDHVHRDADRARLIGERR